MHLVGYSFGGPFVAATCAAFAKLGADAPCVASVLLVDPYPFGSMPSDVPSNEDSLVASARLLDGLSSKLRYADQEAPSSLLSKLMTPLTASALVLALREMLPSDDACEEITRIARFLENCDMTVDWGLPKLDDIPVVVFKTAGGPTHFKARHRANWNHDDGIYGWSALRPNLLATPPTILQGGHLTVLGPGEPQELHRWPRGPRARCLTVERRRRVVSRVLTTTESFRVLSR